MTVTMLEPGVHDLPEADYHAATHALSASGAKLLLPPSCPAKYRWAMDNPPEPKTVFDFGSAAHKIVLGSGPDIEVIEADNWRTNTAKDRAEYARMAGKIPLLSADWARVQAMALAIDAHPLASRLFDASAGEAERSLFWADPEFAVPCRARLDFLPFEAATVPDYKTCADASPDGARKAIGNYSYHLQAAWYCTAVRELGLHDDPAFVFVFQEKDPPYLVNVVQLDDSAIQSGRIAMRAACEIFRDCSAADVWPGYPMDIPVISLPPWASRIPEEYYQ